MSAWQSVLRRIFSVIKFRAAFNCEQEIWNETNVVEHDFFFFLLFAEEKQKWNKWEQNTIFFLI